MPWETALPMASREPGARQAVSWHSLGRGVASGGEPSAWWAWSRPLRRWSIHPGAIGIAASGLGRGLSSSSPPAPCGGRFSPRLGDQGLGPGSLLCHPSPPPGTAWVPQVTLVSGLQASPLDQVQLCHSPANFAWGAGGRRQWGGWGQAGFRGGIPSCTQVSD